MHRVSMNGYSRINKARARRIVEAGGEVFLVPGNLVPAGWVHPCPVAAEMIEHRIYGGTFDSIVKEYESYNCTCRETGRYAAFYVKEAGA